MFSFRSFAKAALLATGFGCLWMEPTAAQGVTLSVQEQTIANHLVNDPGQQRPFLILDPILTQVARARAQDMAVRRYFDHVDPQGIGPNWKVQQAGYALPSGWTNPVSLNYIESIAAGESSADATWNDWMGSAPHKQHLLGQVAGYAQETSYGVGFASVAGSPFTYYWVVITAPPNAAAPSINITSPANNARITTPTVSVSGTTSGSGTVQSVQIRVDNAAGTGTYHTVTGTTNWSGTVTGLLPGLNTIRAISVNGSGTVAQTASMVTFVVHNTLTVSVSGEGSVTAGFLGATQRDQGVHYSITATPSAGSLFAGWSGSAETTHATVGFTMAPDFSLTANFVPNPFLSRRGSYSGLLSGGKAGMVKITVGQSGAFTGRITFDGRGYAVQGRFATDGTASLIIPRRGQSSLGITFQLDVTGSTGLSGSVGDGTVIESFAAAQSYQASAGRFAQAGRYTVSMPANGATTDPNVPKGDGYATLRFDGAGRAALTGSLADGRAFVAAGTADVNASVSFYVPLYARLGLLSGTFSVRPTQVSDLDGTLRWVKPERPTDRISPHAFDTMIPLVGSLYDSHAPVLSVSMNQPDNSELLLGDGNLEAPVLQSGTLDATRISFSTPKLTGLSVKFNAVSGLFSGSFIHPATGGISHIRGVFFQKQNAAFGYFLGVDTSGYASLGAAP